MVRVGVSGWSYEGWRGRFYPLELPRRRQLEYLGERFDSVEINASFYRLQRPEHYRAWRAQTPPGFLFAVKGSRFITHNKKLRDADTALANFFASGVLALGEKLGPLVWQLSERLRFDEARIDAFLSMLPRDTRAAARLAERHDWRLRGRSWTRPGRRRRIRHALEVRNESFLVPDFVRLARRHGVAIVVSDAAQWPLIEQVTTDFMYLRLHGRPATYASRYGPDGVRHWADRIRCWSMGAEPADAAPIVPARSRARRARDVYAYFDNDGNAHAPHDALDLACRLGVAPA